MLTQQTRKYVHVYIINSAHLARCYFRYNINKEFVRLKQWVINIINKSNVTNWDRKVGKTMKYSASGLKIKFVWEQAQITQDLRSVAVEYLKDLMISREKYYLYYCCSHC